MGIFDVIWGRRKGAMVGDTVRAAPPASSVDDPLFFQLGVAAKLRQENRAMMEAAAVLNGNLTAGAIAKLHLRQRSR